MFRLWMPASVRPCWEGRPPWRPQSGSGECPRLLFRRPSSLVRLVRIGGACPMPLARHPSAHLPLRIRCGIFRARVIAMRLPCRLRWEGRPPWRPQSVSGECPRLPFRRPSSLGRPVRIGGALPCHWLASSAHRSARIRCGIFRARVIAMRLPCRLRWEGRPPWRPQSGSGECPCLLFRRPPSLGRFVRTSGVPRAVYSASLRASAFKNTVRNLSRQSHRHASAVSPAVGGPPSVVAAEWVQRMPTPAVVLRLRARRCAHGGCGDDVLVVASCILT